MVSLNTHQTAPISNNNDAVSSGSSNVDDDIRMLDDNDDVVVDKKRSLICAFKEEANSKYSAGNFHEAVALYSKALSFLDHEYNENEVPLALVDLLATIYANRAAVYLSMKQFDLCIKDCDSAVWLSPKYEKAYLRKSKALIEKGLFNSAQSCLEVACQHIPESSLLVKHLTSSRDINARLSRGVAFLESKEYPSARAIFSGLLRDSNASCIIVNLAKAELGLGNTDTALRLTLQVIRSNKTDPSAYEVRAMCMFYNGEVSNSVSVMREALRLDPDAHEVQTAFKKLRSFNQLLSKARDASYHRNFDESTDIYSSLMHTYLEDIPKKSPLFTVILIEKATVHLRLKQYDEALNYSVKAIHARDDNASAWLLKVKALHGLGKHSEALRDLEDLMGSWGAGNEEIRRAFDKADFEVRKLERPDYYKLLDVGKVASQMEIKKQYKVRAMDLHPDRFSSREKYTDEQRKNAEEQFKLLGEALEILTDDFKRGLYDEGYDREAIEQRAAAADQAAHRNPSDYHHSRGIKECHVYLLIQVYYSFKTISLQDSSTLKTFFEHHASAKD